MSNGPDLPVSACSSTPTTTTSKAASSSTKSTPVKSTTTAAATTITGGDVRDQFFSLSLIPATLAGLGGDSQTITDEACMSHYSRTTVHGQLLAGQAFLLYMGNCDISPQMESFSWLLGIARMLLSCTTGKAGGAPQSIKFNAVS
jgi:hypothetical protein